MMKRSFRISLVLVAAMTVALVGDGDAMAKKKKKKSEKPAVDPYAEYVWPPPPDEARIKLDAIILGREDVEAKGKFKRALLRSGPQSQYDRMVKPYDVAFDNQGRILVTDSGSAALLRFDRAGERMDVFGTKSVVQLSMPLGLDVGPDGRIYVADAKVKQVLAFDDDGKLVAVYGAPGELTNPTDVAVSPDGKKLYVADAKANKIVVFGIEKADLQTSFGRTGQGEGEFGAPTSLEFGPEGYLFVVDQLNSRVQVLDPDGEFVDQFGALGVGFGNFVRPKDVAVDSTGLIYVTDNSFNNVQLFDVDFALLTFVGSGGTGPGQFFGASGIDVRGDEFVVVEQLGARVQVFRFLGDRQRE